MQQHIFQFESEPQNTTNPQPSSSNCSSVQERLVTYGSEALDTAEHGAREKPGARLDCFCFGAHGGIQRDSGSGDTVEQDRLHRPL